MGYEVDRRAGTLTYLDADGKNRLIRRLRAAGDPDAPAVEFWNFHGEEEAPPIEFADHWIDGKAPIARYGRFHHHDTAVHSLGYLLLPPEVVAASRARFRALLMLYREPALLKFKPLFEELIGKEIDRLDLASANLATHFSRPLSPSTHFNIEMSFSQISRGTQGILGAYSDFGHATPSERDAMKRILAANPNSGVSDSRLEAITEALVERFWKQTR